MESTKNKVDQAGETICEIKDRKFEIIQSEEKGMKQSKECLHNLWDMQNQRGLLVPEGEERGKAYLKK